MENALQDDPLRMEDYEVLNSFEFDSDRKRQSVILRFPNGVHSVLHCLCLESLPLVCVVLDARACRCVVLCCVGTMFRFLPAWCE